MGGEGWGARGEGGGGKASRMIACLSEPALNPKKPSQRHKHHLAISLATCFISSVGTLSNSTAASQVRVMSEAFKRLTSSAIIVRFSVL